MMDVYTCPMPNARQLVQDNGQKEFEGGKGTQQGPSLTEEEVPTCPVSVKSRFYNTVAASYRKRWTSNYFLETMYEIFDDGMGILKEGHSNRGWFYNN